MTHRRDACRWIGQLEKTRSSKVRNEIGKNRVKKFEAEVGKILLLNTALKTFQLRSVLSNLNRKFLTSDFLT